MSPIQTAASLMLYVLFFGVMGGSIAAWSHWIGRLRKGTTPKPWVPFPQATVGLVDILVAILVLMVAFFFVGVLWYSAVPASAKTASSVAISSRSPSAFSKSVLVERTPLERSPTEPAQNEPDQSELGQAEPATLESEDATTGEFSARSTNARSTKKLNEKDFAFGSVMSTAQLLGVLLVTVFICARTQCSLKKLGWRRDQLAGDLSAGLRCFLMVTPIILILGAVLQQLTEVKYEHPVIEMIKQYPWLLGLAFWQASIVAPISEEFAFRVLLVSWFESIHFAKNKILGLLFGLRVHGDSSASASIAQPVEGSHGLFESMGVGTSSPTPYSLDQQAPYAPPQRIDSLAFSGASVAAVSDECIPSLVRLPWWPSILSGSLFGLAHFSYGVSWVPLILFGIVLGRLYQHRQSIVPVIVVHFLFNSLSLIMLSIGLILPNAVPK